MFGSSLVHTDQSTDQCSGACPLGASTKSPGTTNASKCILTCTNHTWLQSGQCSRCPTGALCLGHTSNTVANVRVQRQFWRLSKLSPIVKRCPRESATTCGGGISTSSQYNESSSELCAPESRATGAYCTLCLEELHYFDTHQQKCRGCSDTTSYEVAKLIVLVFALAVFLFWYWRRDTSLLYRRLLNLSVRMALTSKLKHVVGFYQIVTQMGAVYRVSFPQEYERILSAFRLVELDVFGWIPYLELSCLSIRSPGAELLAYTNFPLVFIVAALLVARFRLAARCRALFGGRTAGTNDNRAELGDTESAADGAGSGAGKGIDSSADAGAVHDGSKPSSCCLSASCSRYLPALPFCLVWTFLVFPSVSSRGFRALARPCDCFGEERCFTFDRHHIDCPYHLPVASSDINEYHQYMHLRQVAYWSVVIYGVIIPMAYAALLCTQRRAIQEGPPNPLSRAMKFLVADYRRETFWWELVSVLHKLLLTGALALFHPGTLSQIVVATSVAACYSMLQAWVAPYRSTSTNLLASIDALALTLTFVTSIVLKASADSSSDALDNSVLIFIMLLLLFAVLGAFLIMITSHLADGNKVKTSRLCSTGRTPDLRDVGEGWKYHLMISHVWSTGQEYITPDAPNHRHSTSDV